MCLLFFFFLLFSDPTRVRISELEQRVCISVLSVSQYKHGSDGAVPATAYYHRSSFNRRGLNKYYHFVREELCAKNFMIVLQRPQTCTQDVHVTLAPFCDLL